MLKIGITERGDAGIDFSWYDKIKDGFVDGAVLISKNVNTEFRAKVIDLYERGFKIIVHCTCTGYGGTALEPNVPDFWDQLSGMDVLRQAGFPMENTVLRIDPIFPSEKGLKQVEKVINAAKAMNLFPMRVRFSVLDEYRHVKERFMKHGWNPLYDGMQASDEQLRQVIQTLSKYPDIEFECCAEDRLFQLNLNCDHPANIIRIGCISAKDLHLMGFSNEKIKEAGIHVNPQNRNGCQCLSCKTELLDNRHQCPHGCVYCYWKN